MTHRFAELMFTPSVKRIQEDMGSRGAYERLEGPQAPALDRLGEAERRFIASRDSFYMGTTSETGWPYVQHRGGPPGFLKVLDERTLAFADYGGNRQYVSVGNLVHDDRVSLFLMDYGARRRLKILGRVRLVDPQAEPGILAAVHDNEGVRAERVLVIALQAFDWNCPQHITPRYTEQEVQQMIEVARRGPAAGTEPDPPGSASPAADGAQK
jgi:predicted pyridoxine 5'-phosphate oxidase superfamily flavin-nucleotide-binding protein